jgi:hypothetical protein
MKRIISRAFFAAVLFTFGVMPAYAQDHGSESGCGDLFGDLIHIKRDPTTGVPILQKRSVLGAQDVRSWAYCPIAVDAAGNELGFLPDSCDVDPATGTVVAVDYFGRLSAGRTKQRNIRMHFDEVIDKIKTSEAVWRDATGRLALGINCVGPIGPDTASCDWTEIDSPVENLSLYHHLVKYGHFQTDPAEEDTWAHGDPALPTQYHPALAAADYAKFVGVTRSLLPVPVDAAATCFEAGNTTCFAPKALSKDAFMLASVLIATASDKTGRATVDLVQYMNRILKVTVPTPDFVPVPPSRLYPKYFDCGNDLLAPPLPREQCTLETAGPTFPAPANEPFVDFGNVAYDRLAFFNTEVMALRPAATLELSNLRLKLLAVAALIREPAADLWVVDQSVQMLEWLANRNPGYTSGTNMDGFVKATNDAVRSIEFVHNYRVPEDLGWNFR